MNQPPPNQNGEKPFAEVAPQPLHQTDADEDDENVKQLDECSALYLLMQARLRCSIKQELETMSEGDEIELVKLDGLGFGIWDRNTNFSEMLMQQ
ncbi:hypothetical protein Lal_00037398 [Lupinus albus]|nr:hypothetical protein Lal_00037398 [Lupinus albus]